MNRPTEVTKPLYADSHEWNRGLMLIACIVGAPLVLVALAKLLLG